MYCILLPVYFVSYHHNWLPALVYFKLGAHQLFSFIYHMHVMTSHTVVSHIVTDWLHIMSKYYILGILFGSESSAIMIIMKVCLTYSESVPYSYFVDVYA
jgi:hypothetical protein